ncbi:unnamed protein product [Protopolystoma xenopodis]|uniref:Uncharacterized protein n=1 Tax=Protopolystoma xenopodis TaxID=117903 RepID=A0A3S5AGG5_9PLAT|nr:unnamed protein product [Protopolystoma xenopodis]
MHSILRALLSCIRRIRAQRKIIGRTLTVRRGGTHYMSQGATRRRARRVTTVGSATLRPAPHRS